MDFSGHNTLAKASYTVRKCFLGISSSANENVISIILVRQLLMKKEYQKYLESTRTMESNVKYRQNRDVLSNLFNKLIHL